MIKRIHIYDLDGVLVDTSHRYRTNPNGTIDLDHWMLMRTRKNISKDRLLPLAKQYANDNLRDDTYVIICTSRAWHVDDIEFIVGRLGAPDKLIMRPENNWQPDDVLKLQALKSFFQLKQFRDIPKTFWDDNRRNLNAVSLLGVRTIHVQSNQGMI
jgi:hypothetical protein